MRRLRSGVTLVEILVVIGIILILMGLAVYGFVHLKGAMATKATMGTFENLQGMLDEFVAINGTGLIQAQNPTNGLNLPVFNDTLPDGTPGLAGCPAPLSTIVPPDTAANSSVSIFDAHNDARYNALAVTKTQQLMALLLRMPHNRETVLQLPKNLFLEPPYPPGNPNLLPIALVTPVEGGPLEPPMLVDGWGNPIIFVAAAGLSGVYLNGDTKAPHTITNPNGRQFWASAGPDGDFTTGDDNIYSFQK